MAKNTTKNNVVDAMEEEIIAMEIEMNNSNLINLNMELPDTDAAAGIINRILRHNRNSIFIRKAWGINYRGYEIVPVTDSYAATWLPKGMTLGVLLLDDAGYPVSLEPEAYQWELQNNILVIDDIDVYKDEEICGQLVACRKLASN